jgi:hypothetical protein
MARGKGHARDPKYLVDAFLLGRRGFPVAIAIPINIKPIPQGPFIIRAIPKQLKHCIP